MKKYILTLAAAILASIGASAAEELSYSLMVNQKDGGKVEFKFDDEPVATIEEDNLKITLYSNMETVLFPIADLENLTFSSGSQTGVNTLQGIAKVSFGLTRTALEVCGLAEGALVDIYSADGRHVAHAVCDANGNVTVALSQLPAGTYAVKAGNKSFKFIR